MPAIGNGNLTLLDLASRMDKGVVAKSIVEILAQRNEIIPDMVWVPCNDGSGHKTTIRTGLPSATWRSLYKGVSETKSVTAQIRDACGMLENYSTVDAALVDDAKDGQAFRLSEDAPFIEGMDQSFAQTLFYGDTRVNQERFMGLSARFNALSGYAGAENVLNAQGLSSNCTSIWLVNWGDQTVHGIYPDGSHAGLEQKDLGEQTVYDASNKPFQAYRSHYKWKPGLCVRDWRYIVRIANIDTTLLTSDAGSGADLIDLLVQALERIRDLNGKPALYCNRFIRSFLRRQQMNFPRLLVDDVDKVGGKHVMSFAEVPVRRCDQILNTETALT